MTQLPVYVLDASALIAFLTAEEGSILVTKLIDQAQRGQAELRLAAINLFEVYYDFLKREANQFRAKEFLDAIYALPLLIADRIDRTWLEQAAQLLIGVSDS